MGSTAPQLTLLPQPVAETQSLGPSSRGLFYSHFDAAQRNSQSRHIIFNHDKSTYILKEGGQQKLSVLSTLLILCRKYLNQFRPKKGTERFFPLFLLSNFEPHSLVWLAADSHPLCILCPLAVSEGGTVGRGSCMGQD